MVKPQSLRVGCLIVMFLLLVGGVAAQESGEVTAPGQVPTIIRTIQVQGNQRVEAGTVASYLLFAPGDPYSPERIDLSVKTLYATGLFADILIEPRDGNVLIRVVENPIVNRVILEGNKSLKDDKITDEIEAQPRAIFTRSNVQGDVQRIIELYRQSGRFAATVDPRVVQQPQNRVDLIFEITEGPVTGVKRINFIGNNEFSDRRLRGEIATAESVWWKFFSSNDNYDPGRLEYDREQLRKFYTDRGFADFRVISAVAELTPDHEDFYITFTIDEGEEYFWGEISVETELEIMNEELLTRIAGIETGDLYKASEVEDAIDSLTFAAGTSGYAFVDIQPDIRRNRDTKTVDLVFNIVEGPRVYIERIDILGNTTTLDYVIRREMEVAEGDAFNRILLDRSRNRIRALRFFEEVEIVEKPGRSPDRAIVEVQVTEQPTGELSFSAGFSSADAFLADLSITQRNLRGRGQLLRFVVRASSNRREIDLRFTEPRFLSRNLAAGIEIFDVTLDFLDEASFRQSRRGAQVSLGFPLTENSTFTVRYSLRQENIEVPVGTCSATELRVTTSSLCDPQTRQPYDERISSILGYTFNWDRRNDPITPTRGFDFRFSQDFAGAGGDVQYLRTDLRGNIYRGLIPGVIASATLAGGYITGWGGEPVQINNRFFKGNFDFRGYDTAGIGPRLMRRVNDNNGTPDDTSDDFTRTVRRNSLGGNAYALASSEVSFPLGISTLLGSLFIEAGTVGLLDEEFKQFQTPATPDNDVVGDFIVDELSIRAMVGASVFWDSPFGPIRFDFSQPLIKYDYDERQFFQFTTRTRF
ncbi:MAG: outer membrane protein assembly factor BamA [Hyphomonadaceae bacterium]|nr:outer membrane protein assembly factor BamA [Hyphomonadaceae bacterium]